MESVLRAVSSERPATGQGQRLAALNEDITQLPDPSVHRVDRDDEAERRGGLPSFVEDRCRNAVRIRVHESRRHAVSLPPGGRYGGQEITDGDRLPAREPQVLRPDQRSDLVLLK